MEKKITIYEIALATFIVVVLFILVALLQAWKMGQSFWHALLEVTIGFTLVAIVCLIFMGTLALIQSIANERNKNETSN